MIEVEIEDPAWMSDLPESETLARAAGQAVLNQQGQTGGVNVLLTDDVALQDLNHRFLKKDKPTNVLSFPALPNAERNLGDVALAHGVCAREAEEQGKTLAHHLQHLVAHGVLHLLGYDHMTDAEAAEMEGLERTVLAGLGVPDPYADDHDRA